MKKNIYIISLMLLTASIIFAQESVKVKKQNILSSDKGTNQTQVVEGDVIFSDGTNNLLRITDEGTSGAIEFSNGVPSDTKFKLYRSGGALFFNGTQLGSGGSTVNSIDDLTDAKTTSSSLFLGNYAGSNDNASSNYNTAIGIYALSGNNSGKNNTAIGYNSLTANQTNGNTAIGASALWKHTTGGENVALGSLALANHTSGENNVAVGAGGLQQNITGLENTAVGTAAGYSATGSGNIFLGFYAGFSETRDNRLYIENSNSNTPLIYGNFDADSVKINGDFKVTKNISVGGDNSFLEINSLAIGSGNTTVSNNIAVGIDNFTFGYKTAAFGQGLSAWHTLSTVIGRYNIEGTDPTAQSDWHDTDPLFEIGNGTNDANRSNAVTVLKNGKVGIGVYSPTASLQVDAVNGVLFEGATTGAIPVEGGGSRMMWYQGKSAFRAGNASSSGEWDDVNIGNYSSAFNYHTTASGSYSFASGYSTEASGQRSTAMGSSTIASGLHSTALGSNTEASGDFSTAIGRNVIAAGNGSLFIGDNSSTTQQMANNDNRFAARFANGYKFYTSSSVSAGAPGAILDANQSAWAVISDSTKKENFLNLNGEEILNKISKFNLRSWNYKNQDPSKFRHYGPMAQEFFKAFGHDGIGTIGNDTTIISSDFDGINLIAIQALEKRTVQQKNRVQNLELRIKKLEKLNEELVKINSEYRTQNAEFKSVNNELKNEINKIKDAISTYSNQKNTVKLVSSK